MELLLVIGVLLALDVASLRWGVDSRTAARPDEAPEQFWTWRPPDADR